MNPVWRWLRGRGVSEGHHDEQVLREEVAAERVVFTARKLRADRVLADFRRAEAVIRGDGRGIK